MLVETLLSRICVDLVFRGEVERAAIKRAVSREAFDVLIVEFVGLVEFRGVGRGWVRS